MSNLPFEFAAIFINFLFKLISNKFSFSSFSFFSRSDSDLSIAVVEFLSVKIK